MSGLSECTNVVEQKVCNNYKFNLVNVPFDLCL